MNTDDWVADSGIGIRELVWGLLTIARAYNVESEEENAHVQTLIIDGKDFLRKTEPEEAA